MLIDRQIGPNRVFTDKDLASFYYVTKLLAEQDREKNFLYVGLGRSPAVLMEFMRKAFDLPTLELPLGGMSEGGEVKLTDTVLKFLDEFLPADRLKGKTVVLVDYAYSGNSMQLAQSLVKAYIEKRLGEGSDTVVRTAPITHKQKLLLDQDSLLQKFDVETRVAHRLIKVLFTEVDKEYYSPYTSVKYDKLARESVIRQDVVQIRERENLSEMMKLALGYYGKEHLIDNLAFSPYMQKRKAQKKTFSYSSFMFGYNPVQEEAWVKGLHKKGAAFYNVDPEIVVPERVIKSAEEYRQRLLVRDMEYRKKIKRQENIETCKKYTARVAKFAFVLILLWAAWYLVKLLDPEGTSTQEL